MCQMNLFSKMTLRKKEKGFRETGFTKQLLPAFDQIYPRNT